MTYQEVIITKEQAFCHLLLYFSLYEDEAFEGEETFAVYSILKSYSFTADVNFPEEVNLFFDYKNSIDDARSYLSLLIQLIDSKTPLIVLFHAAQVAMSDTIYSYNDRKSLLLLRELLDIEEAKGNQIIELALEQRNVKINGSF